MEKITLGQLRKQIQERNGKETIKELAYELSNVLDMRQIELLMQHLAGHYHFKQTKTQKKNEEHF